MARTKHPRSARKATAKDEVIFSPLPPPVAVAAATVLAAPDTAAGTKRRRDDTEDENDEDAFYGRRSAKSRSKGVKNFGGKDIGQEKKENDYGKEQATPARTPATKGPGRRLKFDPGIHGTGLEARLLDLQKHDIFEDMITPRKKDIDKAGMSIPENDSATKNDYQVDGNDETGAQYWETFKCTHPSSASRKIATPKVDKLKKQDSVQAEGLNPEDKGAATSKSAPTSLTLEKRLRRLVSPASNRAKPNSPFLGPPTFVKSSKELTRPSFELLSEERKRIEEEAKKQRQLQERFKTHTEKTVAKKDQQQRPVPAPSRAPTARNPSLFSPQMPVVATVSGPVPLRPLNSRRLTLGEVNQQLETKENAEEALLRVRQDAAEKGKESARLWAEQMKAKAEKNYNG